MVITNLNQPKLMNEENWKLRKNEERRWRKLKNRRKDG